MSTTSTSPVTEVPLRRVAVSVLIGTTIEWYDFMLYGVAAATVFGPLFFPSVDPVAGTLLAFSTFVVGFVARPLGGLIFGHFGDRVGRKKMLVTSLTMMGVATVLMGLIPSYEVIGVGAPLLLVCLRIAQGLGVGGEWGGAVLTAIEYAPKKRRGLYGSLPQVGVPAGLLLSTLGFLAVSQLPDDQFMLWGWRIPFIASALLLVVGMYIRLNLEETPVFKTVNAKNDQAKLPVLTALLTYPKKLICTTLLCAGASAYFYTVTTYSVSYATSNELLSRSEMLVAVLTSGGIMAFALPYVGAISQRIGRAKMVSVGLVLLALWIVPVFAAIRSGNAVLTCGAFVVHALAFSVYYGPQATFIAERFAPRVRFSASSIAFQMGTLLTGATAPLAATALVSATGTIWSVCIYVAALAIVGTVATLVLRNDQPAVDN